MAFPSLTEGSVTINPNFPIQEDTESSAIKSPFEAGYVLVRAAFTRDRKSFKLTYSMLSNANKLILQTHIDTVKDITPFDWTHPKTSTTYSVRYGEIPSFIYAQYDRWNTSFVLVQV